MYPFNNVCILVFKINCLLSLQLSALMFPMVFGVILDDFVCITKILLHLEIGNKICQILQKNMTNTYVNGFKLSSRETGGGTVFSTSCISIAFPLESFPF